MKVRQSLLLYFFIFCVAPVYAQWNAVTTGTNGKLYSVDYKSSGVVWIGGLNGIRYSTNHAATLVPVAVFDPVILNYVSGSYNAIVGLSATTAVFSGDLFGGSEYRIYKTVNSGSNWSLTFSMISGTSPRSIDDMAFENGSTGIAIGSFGMVTGTSNGGSNWSVQSPGTFQDLFVIKNLAPGKYVIGGDDVILRTVDGGTTWTKRNASGNYLGIGFADSIGYAVNTNGNILKSTDSGATWQQHYAMSKTVTAMAVLTTDSILVASTNDLYVSGDGGLHWERYRLPGYQDIRKMSFYNSSNGIAVGDSGYAIHTNNLAAAPAFPIASFSLQLTTSCLGDSLALVNSTAPFTAYSYEWKLDQVSFSTQQSPGPVLMSSPGMHTISLLVTNANGTDSLSRQFTVTGHNVVAFSLSTASDSVCSGSMAAFIIPVSQTGTSYQFRSGYANIGAAVNGNGGALYFASSSGLTVAKEFNVKASKNNGCFTDSLVLSDTIYIATSPGLIPPDCAPTGPGMNISGITNFSLNTINNTTLPKPARYSDYSCMLNTNLVVGTVYPFSIATSTLGYFKIWIDFDNDGELNSNTEVAFQRLNNQVSMLTDSFSFPPTFHLFNQPMRMRVTYADDFSGVNWPCQSGQDAETEDYSVTVIPAPVLPIANYTYTRTLACSTLISFANETFYAESCLWDFGDSTTSTDWNPTHNYSASGFYNVQLIATNSTGVDTLTQRIRIQNPVVPVPDSCHPAAGTGCWGGPGVISMVQLNGMMNFTNDFPTAADPVYEDFTCTKQVHLMKDSSYTMAFTKGGDVSYVNAWFDYNNDGSFNETDERMVSGNLILHISGVDYYTFTVPSVVVTNMPLRMRLIMNDGYIYTNCDPVCGQYEDYTIFIHSHLPVGAQFSANGDTTCLNEPVNFYNLTQSGVSFEWDFGDGDTSTLANPSHTYTSTGTFDVWLKACDSTGNCDSLVKSITVHVPPIVSCSLAVDTFGLYSPSYGLPVGVPIGGHWSGPGVVGWQFVPQQAGVGTHYLVYYFTDNNKCTGYDSVQVHVDHILEAHEVIPMLSVRIIPNPNDGTFVVESTGDSQVFEIMNLLGKSVYSTTLGEARTSVNPGPLPGGLYIYRVTEKGRRVATGKLVIR